MCLNNPEYVKIGDKKYKINTDFRVAIECNDIATNPEIGEYEKCLAIIYKLFGDEGLKNSQDYAELMRLGQKYLLCGKEIDDNSDEPDMDFTQDMDLIETSFYSDYNGLELSKTNMHWWKFCQLLNGLSNSELGNCCILNRIRTLRTTDPSTIQDLKARERLIKSQRQFALKKKIKVTKEQEESLNRLKKSLNIE